MEEHGFENEDLFPPYSQNTSPKVLYTHHCFGERLHLLKQIERTCFMLHELVSDHSDEGSHCRGARPAKEHNAQWPSL